MKLLPLLVAVLLVAAPAVAANRLDASRSSVTAARSKVSDLRARQMELRKELNQVASRIEALKTQKKHTAELDGQLKRSQELSGVLTELAQSVASAEGDAQRENLALLSALSEELSSLRGEFDRQTDREVRKGIIAKLRTLRAEREQVRAALPAAAVPALESPRADDSGSPEDLLEQADALRDREDKIKRELKSLDSRIAEARDERELDRRMNEFLGDESIFDDQDRRFRLRKESTESRTATAPAEKSGGFAPFGGAPAADASPAAAAASAPPPARSENADSSFSVGARDVNQAEKASPSGAGQTGSVSSRTARAADARPAVGGGTQGIAGNEDDDLEDLEVQRNKLKGLAAELEAKAKQLEKKANELR